jgi:hypothetical protein
MQGVNVKTEFDLKLHHVYETVFSVYDQAGLPHHAPIGIRMLGLKKGGIYEMEARIFQTAKMHADLSFQKACTIHFPRHDQLEYFFLAFRDVLKDQVEGIVKTTIKARTIDAPVIPDIMNYIEAKMTSFREEGVDDRLAMTSGGDASIGIFTLKSSAIVMNDPHAIPVSRHGSLLLEFMVKASRLRYLPPGTEEFTETSDELKQMLEKMEKVAPGDEKNVIGAAILGKFECEK